MRITLTVDFPGHGQGITGDMLKKVIQTKLKNSYNTFDYPIKDKDFNNVHILDIDYEKGNHVIVPHYDKKFDAYYVSNTELGFHGDTDWINHLRMDRIDFIKCLENYGAFNNAGSYRSRMMFKRERDAWNAIHEFYEPFSLMAKMAM